MFESLKAEQIGTEATGNTPRKWPARDVNGHPYLRDSVITRSHEGRFVVIPVGVEWSPAPAQAKPDADSVAPAVDALPVEQPVPVDAPKSKKG